MLKPFAITVPLSFGILAAAQSTAKVDFRRDIQPLFREHCIECHGPSQQMMGLRLDRRRDALPNRVGANGARIVPGNSARSTLFRRIAGREAGAQMPPAGPLPEQKIRLLQAWIDEGADWPDQLSGDRSFNPPDAAVEKMRKALREGRTTEFQRLVSANPKSVNAKGEDGWTPLMYATLYSDAAGIRLLLDSGAAVDARNDAGATALMYAVDDFDKTKLLLERGAKPNLRSGEGRTPLMIALPRSLSFRVVNLLLDKGADPNITLPDGRGPLSLGVFSFDPDVLKLLFDKGFTKRPPVSITIHLGCRECVDLMLKHAEARDLSVALRGAAEAGDISLLETLLERGAAAPNGILYSVALSPVPIPATIIKTLLNRGADMSGKTSFGVTTLEFARRQGNHLLVKTLLEAGVHDEGPAPAAPKSQPAASVRAAVERAIPLLQKSDVAFLDRAGCVSCHNNSLTAMMVAEARPRGFRVDEKIAASQSKRIAAFLQENNERALESEGLPGGIDTVSYILLGLAAEKYPSNTITDVWARYVKGTQSPDGRFKCRTVRPPLEASDFQVTAASIRSLLTYAPKSHEPEYRKAVERAIRWMETAEPSTTEDHAFQLLGLKWGGSRSHVIQKTAANLLALQRADGGWGQIPQLASDAYATGQVLVALREAGMVKSGNVPYQRGVRFLMQSQMADGSWFVRTRAPSFQPYFDSDFPHGHDQFISAAATNWAVMALMAAR